MMHQPNDHPINDEIDFDILYRNHARTVLRYLNTHLTLKEDAEDLLIEVFLASLRNPAVQKLNATEQKAWLLRVAHNKLADHYRLSHQWPGSVPIDDLTETLMDDDVYQLPEQSTLRNEDRSRLMVHIGTLSTLQQEILRLRFAYGMHSTEIGKRLDKKATAIRAILCIIIGSLKGSDLAIIVQPNHPDFSAVQTLMVEVSGQSVRAWGTGVFLQVTPKTLYTFARFPAHYLTK